MEPSPVVALAREVYATVRLYGRAPLLGRPRSTDRVCR